MREQSREQSGRELRISDSRMRANRANAQRSSGREVWAQCRWVAGNKLGTGGVPVASDDVDDILQGFEALDEYFRTTDDDAPPARQRKGKGASKLLDRLSS